MRLFVIALLLITARAFAADPTPNVMQEVSPGVYQIGSIRVDQKQRTASFPAKINMILGNLEYLLVHSTGAVHESLLSTEVQPSDLHFAMLLIGAKGAGITTPAAGEGEAPAQINREILRHTPQLKGDAITITAKWKDGEKERSLPVEDWLQDFERKKPAARGPWIYTGSMFRSERFVAQAEGAFAALVTYPGALINNPRPGNDNDLIWGANAKTVPPLNTPIELTIKLEASPETPAQK